MKIAVDAMGGDHGLAPIVEGALQALKERDVELILVGQEDQIKEQLMRLNCTDSRIGEAFFRDIEERVWQIQNIVILKPGGINDGHT